MRQACSDYCKQECETWQRTIERFQGEDKLCFTNESELVADNIGPGKMNKTEKDISEFDGFLEDYLASQELLNIEQHAPVKKGEKVACPKKEMFQPVNISNGM
jgi:hypothetical protein